MRRTFSFGCFYPSGARVGFFRVSKVEASSMCCQYEINELLDDKYLDGTQSCHL
jgi:hypothetical protein